jgi:LacI family transcriptional regulator
VSLGTASRVINRAENVAPGLRATVERVVAELGFQPNVQARGIRSGVTHSVGIVVSDIANPTLAVLVRAAQSGLQMSGYGVLIGCHDHLPEREADLLRFLAGRGVDGLIISTCAGETAELRDMRRRLGVPTVLYDRTAPVSADRVCIDHRQGMKAAADCLLRLGHRRIGLITGPKRLYPARARIAGYAEAHAAWACPVDPVLIRDVSFNPAAGYAETAALLDLPGAPTALILGGVDFLPGALQAIRERGRELPHDLSLIAAADSDLARLATPPVTVLDWSFADAGRHCADVLLGRMVSSVAARQRVSLEPRLLMRGSCAPLPAPGRRARPA